MSADALKKLLLTAAVAALAAVALTGTTVAVVALAGGLEGIYIVGGASAAVVPATSKYDIGVAGRGYHRSSAATPDGIFGGLE